MLYGIQHQTGGQRLVNTQERSTNLNESLHFSHEPKKLVDLADKVLVISAREKVLDV